jgi:hypothetical protein
MYNRICVSLSTMIRIVKSAPGLFIFNNPKTTIMKPRLLLRVAAFLILLHAVAHTIGIITWKDAKTQEQRDVVAAMSDNRFSFMGAVHSFGDYYTGFGIACSVALLLITGLLWWTSLLSIKFPAISRTLSFILFLSLLSWAGVEIIYFFPLAYGITLSAALLTFLAVITIDKHNTGKT